MKRLKLAAPRQDFGSERSRFRSSRRRARSALFDALEPRTLLSVVINSPTQFSALDGSFVDSDPTVGVVEISDDLVLQGAGSILANDPALPTANSASPIVLHVTGFFEMQNGTSVLAENNIGSGSGGDISISVGKYMKMFDGAIISSSRTTAAGAGQGGDITLAVKGDFTMDPGSIVAANTAGGNTGSKAGDILITSDLGAINIDGLVASGPSTTVLGTKLTGLVLAGGNTMQKGGEITIKVLTDTGNPDPTLSRVNVSTTGVIVSQGQDPSADTITLESQCSGIRIFGLVASVGAKQHGSVGPGANVPQVIMRSPRFIEVNGGDLGGVGPNQGRVRADYVVGEGSLPANPNKVDLFARSYITVTGPAAGTVDTNNANLPIFAVSAFGGTANNGALFGGNVTAIAVGDPNNAALGTVNAAGQAIDASEPGGGKGGNIVIKAKNAINLDTSILRAIAHPNFTGGKISVRSFNGTLSWQNGVGNVQPTGATIAVAKRGVVQLTAPGAPVLTGTVFPSTGAPTTPEISAVPFDAAAQAELATLDATLNLPVCHDGGGGNPPHAIPIDTVLTIDVDTTIDFSTAAFDGGGNLIPGSVTYTGDPDLLPFFFPIASAATTPDQWIANFVLTDNIRIDILDGVVLTVTPIGAGNNKAAPGIKIKGGEIFLQEDVDNNKDGGGTILVQSLNKNTGDIFLDMAHSILVDGSIINQVLGTNGTPGDIILKTFCGDVRTGPKSVVKIIGVDHGAGDIIIVDGVPGSLLPGDIVIEGIVRTTYKGVDPGDLPPVIDIVNFKATGRIVIDGTNDFGVVTEAGSTLHLMSGVAIKSLRDPIPGTINLQSQGDLVVLGNSGAFANSHGTVSVKTLSNSSVGGVINAVSLAGQIVAQDRAFDVAARYNATASINLKALGAVQLSAPSGSLAKPLAVLDSSGTSVGGTNRIRSYTATVAIGPNARVLANGPVVGKNYILEGAVPVVGAVPGVSPNPIAPPVGDQILDPLAPLFPDLASLGL